MSHGAKKIRLQILSKIIIYFFSFKETVLKQNQLCHINDFMSHYQPKESTYLKGISFAILHPNISLTTFTKLIFLHAVPP